MAKWDPANVPHKDVCMLSLRSSCNGLLEPDHQLYPSIAVLDGTFLGCDTFLQIKLVEFFVKYVCW